MRTMILLFSSILVISAGCNSASSSSSPSMIENRPKSPEELRMELKMQEQQEPLRYLDTKEVTMRPNRVMVRKAGLFRDAEYATQGYFIEGAITNSASIAKFKDAVLKVSFISQTGSVIRSVSYTVYEFFDPNRIVSFSFKVDKPEATDKFSVSIEGATAVN